MKKLLLGFTIMSISLSPIVGGTTSCTTPKSERFNLSKWDGEMIGSSKSSYSTLFKFKSAVAIQNNFVLSGFDITSFQVFSDSDGEQLITSDSDYSAASDLWVSIYANPTSNSVYNQIVLQKITFGKKYDISKLNLDQLNSLYSYRSEDIVSETTMQTRIAKINNSIVKYINTAVGMTDEIQIDTDVKSNLSTQLNGKLKPVTNITVEISSSENSSFLEASKTKSFSLSLRFDVKSFSTQDIDASGVTIADKTNITESEAKTIESTIETAVEKVFTGYKLQEVKNNEDYFIEYSSGSRTAIGNLPSNWDVTALKVFITTLQVPSSDNLVHGIKSPEISVIFSDNN